ncbi:hypothetical protein TNCV_2058321 [Trichonephila clavipes]|nr:hypothetical protein TNCV_2058321 [Trichonephila clavipes]
MNFGGFFLRIEWTFGGITLRVEHPKGEYYYYTKSRPQMNFLSRTSLLVQLKDRCVKSLMLAKYAVAQITHVGVLGLFREGLPVQMSSLSVDRVLKLRDSSPMDLPLINPLSRVFCSKLKNQLREKKYQKRKKKETGEEKKKSRERERKEPNLDGEKGLVRDWSGKTMNAGGVENRIWTDCTGLTYGLNSIASVTNCLANKRCFYFILGC